MRKIVLIVEDVSLRMRSMLLLVRMATKLGKSDVEQVAKLAKLPVSSGELTKFGEQLSKITDYVGKISNVKFHSPQGDAFMSKKAQSSKSKTNALRKDEIGGKECLTQEEATGNAKNVHNGLFVVPAIFEK